MALVAALVLIFTTMNTVVREQTREIGVMKAIGGTPRTIAAGYLAPRSCSAAIGTVVGIGIGVPLSNWLMTFMSDEFGGTSVGWVSAASRWCSASHVGLGGTALASWPALRHAGARSPFARRSRTTASVARTAPTASTGRRPDPARVASRPDGRAQRDAARRADGRDRRADRSRRRHDARIRLAC